MMKKALLFVLSWRNVSTGATERMTSPEAQNAQEVAEDIQRCYLYTTNHTVNLIHVETGIDPESKNSLPQGESWEMQF